MSIERLIACARDYDKTPWIHQGRVKGLAIDCVGLLVCAARCAGYEVSDVEAYPPVPSGTWLLEELERNLTQVYDGIVPGDVLAFAWAAQVWHVGLVTEIEPRLRMIHCWRNIGKVVEVDLDASWRQRIHSVWRLPREVSA